MRRVVSWRMSCVNPAEKKVSLADSVETLGVDLRTKVKARSKRKSEEEKVLCEVFPHTEQ